MEERRTGGGTEIQALNPQSSARVDYSVLLPVSPAAWQQAYDRWAGIVNDSGMRFPGIAGVSLHGEDGKRVTADAIGDSLQLHIDIHREATDEDDARGAIAAGTPVAVARDGTYAAFSAYVPLRIERDRPVGALGVHWNAVPDDEGAAVQSAICLSHGLQAALIHTLESSFWHELETKHRKFEKEAMKRDLLFQVVKKLHSKIDVDSVLMEIIDNMNQIYPSVEIDILLSQDYTSSSNIPVKPLSFVNMEDDLNTHAFMEGRILYETGPDGATRVSAPLSGKQGVYGILEMISNPDEPFDKTDIMLISMIADSAGIAFENAKLYEQSNLLISELRLINEITQRLNKSLKLSEIFNFASNELVNIFGADYGCILQVNHETQQMVVQASNLSAMMNELFTMDYGFAGIVYQSKEPVIISDYTSNPRIQSKLMESTNSRSLMAAPILVNGEVIGVILVAHHSPNYFSYDNYKLLQVLSGHIGLAMTNASLHAEVRRMVITDNLTGLYARSYLNEQIGFMQKKDFCGSLILVDIDHFKSVNDTYGHQVGDQILIQVSQIIRTSIRDSDIAARWGGEELAIYLPQAKIDQASRVAERIRSTVFGETNPQVSVSCGLSEWNWEDDKISVEALFYRADMALYEAKNSGRNQVKVG